MFGPRLRVATDLTPGRPQDKGRGSRRTLALFRLVSRAAPAKARQHTWPSRLPLAAPALAGRPGPGLGLEIHDPALSHHLLDEFDHFQMQGIDGVGV